jgi:hypothetical protein
VEIKKIGQNQNGPQSASDRFRVVISDGINNCQAMLATQQNQLVFDDKVQPPSSPAPLRSHREAHTDGMAWGLLRS